MPVHESSRREERSLGRRTDGGEDDELPVADPVLVAQVEFVEWTPDGHLRHSRFIGLRDGKWVLNVVREG